MSFILRAVPYAGKPSQPSKSSQWGKIPRKIGTLRWDDFRIHLKKRLPENVPQPSDRPASGTQGTFETVMDDEIAGLLQNGEDNEVFLTDELSFPGEPENNLDAEKIVEVF